MNKQKTLSVVFVLAILAFIAPALLWADDAEQSEWRMDTPQKGQAEYYNPKYGKLVFTVPPSWNNEFSGASGNHSAAITFAPKSGNSFKLIIDPLVKEREAGNFEDQESVRMQVEQLGNQFLPFAVEEQLTVQELKGDSATGYYFSITDKAPKAGEWECLTQGRISVGDYFLHFSIFSHTLDSKELKDALEMISTAKFSKD